MLGSYQYYPTVNNLSFGGWAFTIGSAGFFIADSLEWWKNNRVGCFFYHQYEQSYEQQIGNMYESKRTLFGKLQRAEVGLNFFMSLTGSTLYLIGSIMYIPFVNMSSEGDIVFIYGSAIIFVAQMWKLFRTGCTDEEQPLEKSFRFKNFKKDIFGALVDLTAGVGGLCYLIACIILLPQYDTNTAVTHLGVNWFMGGGINYFASGVFMFIRYFLIGMFPDEEDKSVNQKASGSVDSL